MDNEEWNHKVRDKMGKYVKSLAYLTLIFIIVFLISGVWHAILTKQLNSDFFLLVGGKKPRDICISICALSFGSIVLMIVLVCSLYLSGTKFIMHALFCALTVISILLTIGLTLTNLVLTADKAQDRFKKQITDYVDNNSTNEVVSTWMKKYQCTNSTSCEKAIKQYVSFLCNGELVACCVMLFITISCIIGVSIAVGKMGMLKRPDDEPDKSNLA